MNIKKNSFQYFKDVEKITPQVYYHYTSLDALFNIVESKTFRLTSLRSSNDKKELFYDIDRFLTDFKFVCEQEENVDTELCLLLLLKSIEENKTRFLKEGNAKRTPYALCFSNNSDSLTHWDRYAANCTGVCIGVNLSALDVLYSRTNNYIYGSSLFNVEKILYTQDEIYRCIKESTVSLVDKITSPLGNQSATDVIEILKKSGFVYAVVVYLKLRNFVKNSSFIDENEIRLYHEIESIPSTIKLIESIVSEIKDEIELDIDLKEQFEMLVEKIKIKEEHYMMTKSGIRSYHNLYLEDIWGSGLIPEIILGPMCIQNRKELERFLRNNGLGDTKVRVSKVPIR